MKNLQNLYNIIFGNLILIILIASAVTLITMYNNLSSTVQDMSKVMIQDRLDLTKKELDIIFQPINQRVETVRERGKKGLFRDIQDIQMLNDIFIPLLKSSPSISSMMIANELGDEYMLLQTDSLWITRITEKGSKHKAPIEYYWNENSIGEDLLTGQKMRTTAYDPRTRPWYKLAMENQSNSISNWTSPYTFFTTKQPGITVSTKWYDPKSKQYFLIGMDVLISDLSNFTTTIDITENGKIFILSDSALVIGLPKDERFADKNERKKYTLKRLVDLNVPVLNKAIQAFREKNSTNKYLSFQFKDEIWWAGVQEYELSPKNTLIIGAVVPETDFSHEIEDTRRLLLGGFGMIFLFFVIILYSFLQMKRANKIIATEKDKNEQLLLNTLPIKVVSDLKESGKSDPQKFENVTVYFSDIVGFTQISSSLDPKELIQELNDIYSAFDEIMIKYDCERIKTIGDAYLAVCGMPQKNDRHAEMMLRASLEVMQFIEKRNITSQLEWKMRIGLHSGNVVGGIVGVKKYLYDVFGDTINTASRMESNSAPMRVNISEETYRFVKDSDFIKSNHITFERRTPIQVKGKGAMIMYFVSRPGRSPVNDF
ncbi:MAG: hypothetical protein KAQ62_04080 [Cyclobacteriaceae bacterium]|nr:hypothetical protein [Cyclobacteriaceae bacterium]MCK5703454.1 hypothetical protein [Cyclobacteriaceae bacterium]